MMKKIISICLCASLLLLTACTSKESKEEKGGAGQILLSFSSIGANFLDFPLMIKSVVLLHDSGQRIEIAKNIPINLANFNEHPYFILSKVDMPSGDYTRIVMNLEFNEQSTVTYVDKSTYEKPISQGMISQTGKKLGVDHKNFMINMPFYKKNISISKNKTTHLDVHWNLNTSTDIYAPDDSNGDDWLIEFKPIVQAAAIDANSPLMVEGLYVTHDDGSVTLRSVFSKNDEGTIRLQNKNTQSVMLDDAQGSLAAFNSSATTETYVSTKVDTNLAMGMLNASVNDLHYFSKDHTLIKGLISEVNDDRLTIIGASLSRGLAVIEANKTFRLPKSAIGETDRAYSEFSSINLKLLTTDFVSLTKPDTPVNGALSGPEDEVIDLDEKTKVVTTETESDEDGFVIQLSDENITKSKESGLTEVTVISNNGVLVDKTVEAQLPTNLDIKLESGVHYYGGGYMRLSGSEEKLKLKRLVKLNTKSPERWQFNYKYEGDSVFNTSDLNADKNGDQPTISVETAGKIIGTEKGDNLDFELVSKLNFSRSLDFVSGSGKKLSCGSVETNLPKLGSTFEEGRSVIMFELMKNDEPWNDDIKSKLHFDVLNKKEFDGDYSTGEFFYSIAQIHNWFQTVQDSGKKFYIHSVQVFAEPGEDGDSCDFKASYIHVRWFEEGTILDAYRKAWLANTRRDIGIGTGLALSGIAGLGILALMAKKIHTRVVNERILAVRQANGYIDITIADPDAAENTDGKYKTVSVTQEQLRIIQEGDADSEKLIRRIFTAGSATASQVTLDPKSFSLQVLNESIGDNVKDKLMSVKYGLPKNNYLSEGDIDVLKEQFKKVSVDSDTDRTIRWKKK